MRCFFLSSMNSGHTSKKIPRPWVKLFWSFLCLCCSARVIVLLFYERATLVALSVVILFLKECEWIYNSWSACLSRWYLCQQKPFLRFRSSSTRQINRRFRSAKRNHIDQLLLECSFCVLSLESLGCWSWSSSFCCCFCCYYWCKCTAIFWTHKYSQRKYHIYLNFEYKHSFVLVLNTQNQIVVVSDMQFAFSVRVCLHTQTENQTKRQTEKNVFFPLYI